MKNVKNLLKIFLIIALNNGCASFASGRKCVHDPVPIRPEELGCISNGLGGGGCFDPRMNPNSFILPIDGLPSTMNMVCTPPQDRQAQEEWIKQLLIMLGQ